jgi:hypothetical protein
MKDLNQAKKELKLSRPGIEKMVYRQVFRK